MSIGMAPRVRFRVGLLGALLLAGTALAMDGDIVFPRDGAAGGMQAVVFPHWIHRIRYRCYACHPGLFEMKAGANDVSMAAMAEGKFCGACHNGTVAWAAGVENCNRCHAGE